MGWLETLSYGLTVALIGMVVVFVGLILLVWMVRLMSIFCMGIDQSRLTEAEKE